MWIIEKSKKDEKVLKHSISFGSVLFQICFGVSSIQKFIQKITSLSLSLSLSLPSPPSLSLSIYEVHMISFHTFLVWAFLLIGHT